MVMFVYSSRIRYKILWKQFLGAKKNKRKQKCYLHSKQETINFMPATKFYPLIYYFLRILYK